MNTIWRHSRTLIERADQDLGSDPDQIMVNRTRFKESVADERWGSNMCFSLFPTFHVIIVMWSLYNVHILCMHYQHYEYR